MFFGDEVVLEVSFVAARDRLAYLAERGALLGASEDAYGQGTAGVTRVGMAGLSKLVRVQVHKLAWNDRSAGVALRWEATGPGGALFPVLDADIKLAPAGEQLTLLTLAGSYRPPLGAFGEAIDRAALHRIAAVTIRGFLAQVVAQITGQPGRANAAASNGAGASTPPGAFESS